MTSMYAAQLLAERSVNTGLWGTVVVVGLFVASALLFVAMRRSLSKVPDTFDAPPGREAPTQAPEDPADGS